MQGLGDTFRAFLANPFDPNRDGQTSALEWAAFLGLLLVIWIVWTSIIGLVIRSLKSDDA